MAEDVCIFSVNAIRAKVVFHSLQQAGISAVLSPDRPMNYRLSIYGSNEFTPTIFHGIVVIDAYSYTHAELKAFQQAASGIFARMHVVVLKAPQEASTVGTAIKGITRKFLNINCDVLMSI
ncbi:hypothetical protein MBAV_001316 [Candidatus Magnetobacterium bavaricum]|uniref:Uncharacterized protein n=1 Tax=Candidatus Magnetobacterium bavaricum TaxID=29290 RepID=A0A0F3GX59_9BACT|nr:hypothetical protein MBAV_001316 [Candidatus Magnetobacterium bavaricum]